jgi:hypothetical protein
MLDPRKGTENSNRAIDELAADFLKGLPFLPIIDDCHRNYL